MEEEEQYLTIGADRRPYIAVRSKRGNKLEENNRSEEVRHKEMKIADSPRIEDAEARKEEKVTVMEEEDGESESLVREYQTSAIPDMCDLKLMEFYGGAEWRLNEEADLKRCIQRILEIELVDNYQKNLRPSDEVRCVLKEIVGENWREEQGLPGRNYIGMIAKR